MGAINNAFNQAAGAVAGAGLAIKHAKETDFSKAVTAEHSALVAKNQAVEAEAAANELNTKVDDNKNLKDWVGTVLNEWTKKDEYDKIKDDKNVPEKTVYQKLTEWQASKRAMDELGNKLNGIEAVRQRALDQRAYADKASKIASKAQQKYQSRWEWGGK